MGKVWYNNYEKLKAFHAMHGHCIILRSDQKNKRLRDWLHECYRLHSKSKLEADAVDLLNRLNVDWSAFGKQWERWEEQYRQLIAFKDIHGHCNVSQLKKGLGPWISAQRVMYRQGLLKASKQNLLSSLGLDWNPSKKHQNRWMEQFTKLKTFQQTHGHCNVPRRAMPDPGIWVSAQRTAYRKGTLSAERIALLESIGFDWVIKKNTR